MKKIISLALAAVCALAFASAVDAGTGLTMKAKKVNSGVNINTTYVNGGRVDIKEVTTEFNAAYDTSKRLGNLLGNQYEVRSLATNGVVPSQTIYDDLRTFVESKYSNLIPAVAGETDAIAMASIVTGYKGSSLYINSSNYDGAFASGYYDTNGVYNLNKNQGQKAKANYLSISEIANKVVPGRVAGRSTLNSPIQNAALGATQIPNNAMTKAEAKKYLENLKKNFDNAQASAKTAYDNVEIANAQKVANYINGLMPTYNTALEAKNAAEKALNTAQSEYDAAVIAQATAQSSYDAKVKARENADKDLTNAQKAENDAKTDKEAKEALAVSAQTSYDEAVIALNAFDYAMAVEGLDDELDTARELRDEAYQAYIDAQEAEEIVETEIASAKLAYESAERDYQTALGKYNFSLQKLNNKQESLEKAVSDANSALKVANKNKEAAVKAYNEKVQAREDAKDALDKAQKAETKAQKALKNAKDVTSDKEVALANAQRAYDDAVAELARVTEAQKAKLTAFINTLKDKDGKSYNISDIPGYDDLRFDQVAYVAKVYQAETFVAPELNVYDEGEISAPNEFKSVTAISYSGPKYEMRDGVLTEVVDVSQTKTSTFVYVQTGHIVVSPLVLDITGNGKLQASNGQNMPGHDVVTTGNIIGDFFGDGFEVAMEWVGPQDGLLVAPKADGSVDMNCIFGTAGGYENGYEKLSLYDQNGDMKVSGDELNSLSIWQDANSNGIAEANEVKTVKSLGITSINLNFNKDNYVSSFERNGNTYKMWDWWPNAVELIKIAVK